MFVSDFFTSLRNEIDLETETRLIQVQDLMDTSENTKPIVEDADGLDYWNDDVYNLARLSMIDELKTQENELLSSLKPIEEFELILQGANELSSRISVMEKAIDAERSSDWINLKKLIKINNDIEKLFDSFKSKALNNRTFLFKSKFLNPLGALIVFEDHYLNEAEISFIK